MVFDIDFYKADSKDELVRQRSICLNNDCKVRVWFLKLRACEKRIELKPYTAENCHQETTELMEALDHCVGDKAFSKLF